MYHQYPHLKNTLTPALGKGKNKQDLFSNLSSTDIGNLTTLLGALSQKEISDVINEPQNGHTALQQACINGNERGVILLLAHGADPQPAYTFSVKSNVSEQIIELLDEAMTRKKLVLQ